MVLAIHNGAGWYLTTDADIDKAVADGANIYEESDSGSRTLLYSPDDGWVQPRPTISSTAKNYFSHDDQGAHISTVDGDPNAGKNVLLDSDGLHVRNGETELASFTEDMVQLGAASDLSRIFFGGGSDTGVLVRKVTANNEQYKALMVYSAYGTTDVASYNALGQEANRTRISLGKGIISFFVPGETDSQALRQISINGKTLNQLFVNAVTKTTTITVTHNGRSATLTLRRSGNVVTASMHGIFAILSRNTLITVFGTIPYGYKPMDDRYISVANVSSNAISDHSRWMFGADGIIKVTTNAPANTLREYYIDATWITSENMPS